MFEWIHFIGRRVCIPRGFQIPDLDSLLGPFLNFLNRLTYSRPNFRFFIWVPYSSFRKLSEIFANLTAHLNVEKTINQFLLGLWTCFGCYGWVVPDDNFCSIWSETMPGGTANIFQWSKSKSDSTLSMKKLSLSLFSVVEFLLGCTHHFEDMNVLSPTRIR